MEKDCPPEKAAALPFRSKPSEPLSNFYVSARSKCT
jgi:hypothetical protein